MANFFYGQAVQPQVFVSTEIYFPVVLPTSADVTADLKTDTDLESAEPLTES